MTRPLDDFISELSHLNVELWLDGDNLRYKAPKGMLSATLLGQLRERKAEILTFLRHADATSHSDHTPIKPVARKADLPLSFAQQRLWFLTQLDPDSSAYNLPRAYRLTGILNVSALEHSLCEIVRRHESLRTTFREVGGQPSQVITPYISLTLPLINLQKLPLDQRQAIAEQKVIEEVQQPFDLTQGPLLRAKLLQLSAEEHVLLLVMHHIVSDGWSIDIFFQELAALYDAFSNNKASPLSPLPIQYADYAIWQRQWLQGEVLESQLDYWKQQLTDISPVLTLPTDRPRPPEQTYRGAYQTLHLPCDLTEALKALSQQQGVTLYMTLMAAFQTLLHRYCGQDDIIVGTPIAGRNQLETEALIGFFNNNLALRTHLGGNPSFQELLTRVRKTVLAAHNHPDLPFEKLVEELQLERDQSHAPLFQVVFVLQHVSWQPLKLSGLAVVPAIVHNGGAKVDLTLMLGETAQGLNGFLEYNTDLFDDATITRLLNYFQTLLEGIIANPDQRLSALSLLTSAERQQLLVDWNDTQTEYSQDRCIHQLFEAQVEQTPDAVVLVFANQPNAISSQVESQLTYRQLNTRANQLAHHLQTLGVGPGDLVGLCLERSIEMVASLLGILKAGAAYVPLDPTYPQERLAYMLSDAQVSVLLTQQQHLPQLPQIQAQVVCLETSRAEIAQAAGANPVSAVKPDNLAYVIYTSGSTGKPKGVLVAHQGLCNLAQAQIQRFDLQPASRVLQFASLSFDAAISEIIMALCSGATLCLAPQEALLPGPNLVRLLQQQAITHVTLPPSALAALSQASLPALQTLIVAGEACPPDLARQWAQHRRFFNAYGPSEATVCATIADCTEITGQRLPIGRAIANAQVYILDRHLQPVPIGVPGELHISGVGLAQGYLNQPELTAEKFIPNPFLATRNQKSEVRSQDGHGAGGKDQGSRENPESRIQNPETPLSHTSPFPASPPSPPGLSRLYKTGDLARYLPTGEIEFLGRIDHQVKVRGFRIELGEIEVVLREHPAVEQAVVIVRAETTDDQRLIAYVVPNRHQTLTSDELRGFLKQRLPDYMRPGALILVDALPLSPNGKIDRQALSSSDWSGSAPPISAVPSTLIEQQLAEIWAEVLKLDQVDIHDDFFELGGHSLLATQVMSRIVQTLSIDISLQTLFKFPTVAKLAEHIETVRWIKDASLGATADHLQGAGEVL